MKKIVFFVFAAVIIFGGYFLLHNSKVVLEADDYSLIVPEGWSGEIQPSGPYEGPFIDTAILRSPDFVADPEGGYDAALKGAEIRIYPPFPTHPDYENLSKFTDPYNRSAQATEHSTVAGELAITYVWAYEGPILLKTAFVHEKRLYTATLQIADAEGLDISAFDFHRATYNKVLDSFRFK